MFNSLSRIVKHKCVVNTTPFRPGGGGAGAEEVSGDSAGTDFGRL